MAMKDAVGKELEKQNRQQSKSQKNSSVTNADISNNPSNHASGNKHSMTKNGIIDDGESDEDVISPIRRNRKLESFDDIADSNACGDPEDTIPSSSHYDSIRSRKQNNDADMRSCKPCYVMLERLSKNDLRHLMPKKKLANKNSRTDPSKRKDSQLKRLDHAKTKNERFKLRSLASRNIVRRKPEVVHVSQQKRRKVQSRKSMTDILESDNESHASYPIDGTNDSEPLPYDEKFDFNHSFKIGTAGKNSGCTTSPIQDLVDNKGIGTSPTIPESKILLQKNFGLSPNEKTPSKNASEVPQRHSHCRRLLSELDTVVIPNSVDDEAPTNNSSAVNTSSRVVKQKVANVKGVKTSGYTTQPEDANENESSELTQETSQNVTKSPKHFSLSLLKKSTNTEDGAASRRRSRTNISRDSDEISNSIPSKFVRVKSKLKRKFDSNDSREVVPSKLPKSRNNHEEVNKSDSNPLKVEVFKQTPQKSGSSDPNVSMNGPCEQKLSPKDDTKVVVSKNPKVSLVKLESVANSYKSTQVENVKNLDLCKNTSRTKDSGRKSRGMVSNSPIKNANTRITDYFAKIDKKQIMLRNSTKNANREVDDLILKRKYGILKDVIISVIDLKQLKIFGPKYSASEIEKVTSKRFASSIDSHSTITTTNIPSSLSSIPASRTSASNSPESSTNAVQSFAPVTNAVSSSTPVTNAVPSSAPITNAVQSTVGITNAVESSTDVINAVQQSANTTDSVESSILVTNAVASSVNFISALQSCGSVTHVLAADNHLDALSPDSSTTEIVPVTLTLSPIFHKSSSTKKSQNPVNKWVFEKKRVLRPRNEKQLADSTNHVDYHFVYQDGSVDRNVPKKSSLELRSNSPSSSTIVNELGTNSSCPLNVETAPQALETLNSGLEISAPEPENHSNLIDDHTKSNSLDETIKITDKLPESIEVQEKGNDTTNVDVTKDLLGVDKPSQEISSTVDVDISLDTIVDQPTTNESAIIPVNGTTIKKESKTPPMNRSLPVNSMTFLSREMLEENNSWFALADENIAEIGEIDELMAADHSTQEDGSSQIEHKSPKDATRIPSNTTEDIDTNIDVTVGKQEHKSSSKDVGAHAEFTNEISTTQKLPSPQKTGKLDPKPPTPTNIQTSSSPLKTRSGKVKTKVHDIKCSESSLAIDTVEVRVPASELISPIKSSVNKNSVDVAVDQRCETRTDRVEILTESPEERRLIIDTDSSDLDLQSADDTLPHTTSPKSFTSSTSLQKDRVDSCTRTVEDLLPKKCIICKKGYKNALTLGYHLKLHINRANTSCVLCDKPLTKSNAIKHYLEHCGCLEVGSTSQNVGKKRSKVKLSPKYECLNRCDVCLLTCNSEEELFKHLYSHTSEEHQVACENAMAKQHGKQLATKITKDQVEDVDTSGNKENGTRRKVKSKTNKVSVALPVLPPVIRVPEISICTCHTDERLAMSGGVIIEVALACIKCKIFFKYEKCLEEHLANGICKRDTDIRPKMFCNECCVIIGNWYERLDHLKVHIKDDVGTKVSFLCKPCNILFFGIGSIFHEHWLSHCRDSMFVADHASFPKNVKVKIVESESSQSKNGDEPTKSLFVPELQCAKCDEFFQTDTELDNHFRSSGLCKKKLHSATQVTKEPETSFKLVCSLCNKEFTDKSNFDAHIKDFMDEHGPIKDFLPVPRYSDTASGNENLTCSICKIKFKTEVEYEEHLINHEVIRENFYCKHCAVMLDCIEDFKRHSAEHKGSPEDPVVCEVIFPMATFHCKPCKMRFDNQSKLDEHLATHPNSVEASTKSDDKISEDVAAIKAEVPFEAKDQQELDKVVSEPLASTHKQNTTDTPTISSAVIQISDDSSSNDMEIILIENEDGSEEGNTSLQEQPEKMNNQESKKPAFLRVKNLQDLLPYACSKCKAVFDTQINLDKHTCIQNINPEPNYSSNSGRCQSNNISDHNQQAASRPLPKIAPKTAESLVPLVTITPGQQIIKCNICSNFESRSGHTMGLHLSVVHPDICRQYNGKISSTLESELKGGIHQPEASSLLPLLQTMLNKPDNNLPAARNSNTSQPNPWVGAAITPHNTSLPKSPDNLRNPSQRDSIHPMISSANSLPQIQQVNNCNNLQQPVGNSSLNNLSSLVQLKDTINPQPSGTLFQLVNHSNNFAQPVSNFVVTSSSNNLPLSQPLQNFHHSQQLGRTRPPIHNNTYNSEVSVSMPSNSYSTSNLALSQSLNSSNFQQQVQNPAVITTSGNSSTFLQAMPIFNNPQQLCTMIQPNNFQSSVQIQPTTSLASNLCSLNVNNPQQLGSMPQRDGNNSNSFPQSISIPPTTSTAGNLSTLPPSSQTFQIQLNEANLTFNDTTNVMHTVPTYFAKFVYSCNICKNFECMSEQELKAHKDSHEPAAKTFFKCKICMNIFFPTEERLKDHMAMWHNTDQMKSRHKTQNIQPNSKIKCKQCSQTFTTVAQFTQHVLTSHPMVSQIPEFHGQLKTVYPYTCRICSIGFFDEGILQAHNRQIHSDFRSVNQKVSNNHKNLYKCDTCGLLLISEETLNYHKKSHTVGFQ